MTQPARLQGKARRGDHGAMDSFERNWNRACHELAQRDPILAGPIERWRDERLRPHGDLFHSLARAMVGQQISVAAAEALWQRLLARLGRPTPTAFLAAGGDTLAACGLTRARAGWLVALAAHFQRPEAARDWARDWAQGTDDDLTRALAAFAGVGPWTAAMAAIFALGRLDVLPLSDIGLQRAVCRLYGGPRSADRLAQLARAWRPWRTVACWHLWRDLDPLPVAY